MGTDADDVHLGLLLPTREAVIYEPFDGDPRPLVDLAVRAERGGFDSVWAGDSLLARPRAEPLALLAAVAASTERVQLGTAVLLPALRTPEQLAQQASTVDALSGGRLLLGIGTGPPTPGVKADYDLVGADFERRASATAASALRARSLWRDEPASEGRERMQPTPPGDGPPLWMGGHGPRTLQRTGRSFDGWFPTATGHDMYRDGLATVHRHAQEAGRDPTEITAAAYLTVTIGDQAKAQAALAEHSQLYYGVPHEVVSRQQGSIAGSAERVLDWIGGFLDAGCTHICLRIGSADIDHQLEQLMALLPRLRR